MLCPLPAGDRWSPVSAPRRSCPPAGVHACFSPLTCPPLACLFLLPLMGRPRVLVRPLPPCPPGPVARPCECRSAGWSSWAWRRPCLGPSSPRSSSLSRPDALPLAARPAQLRLIEMRRLGCQPSGKATRFTPNYKRMCIAPFFPPSTMVTHLRRSTTLCGLCPNHLRAALGACDSCSS